MDNYYDDIELEYNNFLAEQELYDNLISLGASVYNESAGLLLIQEDYKDTINKYIDKIVTGLQSAWEKFKTKVVEFAVQPIIDRIKDKISTYKDGSVKTEYWHKYNMEKFDAIKMVPFDLNKLSSVDDKNSYLKSVYPNIFVDDSKSFKENIINQVIDTEDEHVVTSEDINNLFTFVTNGFKEKVNKVETELKQFNSNITAVKTAANVNTSGEDSTATVTQQTTATNKYQMKSSNESTLINIYESYNIFNEAEDDNTKKQKAVNTDNKGGSDGKEKNNIKRITWYLSGNTDIMSAKLKILRQRYLDAINILKIAFPKEKEDNENKNEVKTELKMKKPLKMKSAVEI